MTNRITAPADSDSVRKNRINELSKAAQHRPANTPRTVADRDEVIDLLLIQVAKLLENK